MMHYSTGIHWK